MSGRWQLGRHLAMAGICVLLNTACATVQFDAGFNNELTLAQTDFHALTTGILSAATEVELLSKRNDNIYSIELTDARKRLAYASNSSAYDKVRVDLLDLQVRIAEGSSPAKQSITQSIALIQDNLFGEDSMRGTHLSQGALSAAYVINEEKIVDAQFEALGTYSQVTNGPASLRAPVSK